MMSGSVLIDGIDVFDSWGAVMLRGSDAQLLRLPERKVQESVSYYEVSGEDVDLEDIVLQASDVELSFDLRSTSATTLMRNLDAFYSRLSAPGYRNIYVRTLSRTFELRYLSSTTVDQRGALSKSGVKNIVINVRFAIDNYNQMLDDTYSEPTDPDTRYTYVKLDGKDLASYGITVRGVYPTALQLPARKAPLTAVSLSQSGGYADLMTQATLEAYDVVISCSMRCDNIAQYYNHISALFARMCKTSLLDLALTAAGKNYSCYYVRQQDVIKQRAFDPGVALQFDIVLRSTDYELLSYLLGSETLQAIITEDEKLLIIS